MDPDTEKPAQGRPFNVCVPLDGVSWNQLAEELKGWLELRDILAVPALIR